jgi:hypothetical protein
LHGVSPQIARVERYLEGLPESPASSGPPVFFFNASTRIHRLSLNGAFSLLAAWGLRAAGHDARYLVCHRALHPCVLGTDRRAPQAVPPCGPCLDLSAVLFPPSKTLPLRVEASSVEREIREMGKASLATLMAWESEGLPLGELTLPSVRWILRRHALEDTEIVRRLFAGYLASAACLAKEVGDLLSRGKPKALVVFNGVFYPEAVARRVAENAGLPVVTHEVGLQPGSAFFSHREATFREVEVPDGFTMTAERERVLDEVLARRFRGDFTMAGIRFWPEMKGLPPAVVEMRRSFRQMVSVFTNVVFDTSQIHAHVLFPDMFAWLADLAETIRRQDDTLFVLRAHPDETRRGKESQETVSAWLRSEGLEGRPNVVGVGPDERVSSYDLIRNSKFVLVYNSSIGLEASILGTPVLSAGRARFTQLATTTFPSSRDEYRQTLARFLSAERLEAPAEHTRNARAFLYVELFHASLDLSEFLVADSDLPGMVRFSPFAPNRLGQAEVLRVLTDGILEGKPFLAAASPAGGPVG